MPLIEASNISKSFGKNLVLDKINLELEENEILGIIGKNGSGKTTLLKTLVGFVKPDTGYVKFNDKDLNKNFKIFKKQFGFATQESAFYPKLNVKENLEYFGNLYGLDKKTLEKNIDKLLKLVELVDAKDVLGENLSIGMQRRLEIACSLVHDPKILILDEPTEDLDMLLREDILDLIKEVNKLGTTVVLTSHMLDEVQEICSSVVILHKKKVISQKIVDKMIKDFSKNYEIELKMKSNKYDEIIKNLKLKKTEILDKNDKLLIQTSNPNPLLTKISKYLKLDDIINFSIRKPNLGEIFERLEKNE